MTSTSRALLRRAILALALLTGGTSGAHAQLSADLSVEQFDWREHTTPIAIHEHGPRFSGGIGFMQPKERGLLFAYHGNVYVGNVEYNGSFQFDATKVAKGASNYIGSLQWLEARWRWPGAADALVGIDGDFWTRQLSTTQQEDYRIVSLRLGVERVASATSRISAGIGMRTLISTHETATIEVGRDTYDLLLKPGRGSHPYLHGGYRVASHLTVRGYWDGMTLGESNSIVLLKRGQPRAVVSQPSTDVSRIGLGLAYGW